MTDNDKNVSITALEAYIDPAAIKAAERKLAEVAAMSAYIRASNGEDVVMPALDEGRAPTEDEIQRDKAIQEMKGLLSITKLSDQPTSAIIRDRILAAGDKFYSNSNISQHIHPGELEELIDEATAAFANVLDVLVIDQQNDPNAIGTAKRLAKMYINELMEGRYYPAPDITAFPNQHTGKETGFGGMLVVRSEIKSMCSHHHQIVDGVAYIGIIPKGKVIGLSKYTRLAQHLARRGTLQEELAEDIAQGIMEATGSADVGIMVMATHGCCQNRGIMANNSNTQTTVLYGDFMDDPTVRKEFHDNVMMQILKEGR